MNDYREDPTDQTDYAAVEAEQALIGCIFCNENSYWKICDKLSPEHFYEPVHALIYGEIVARLSAGQSASPLVVGIALKDSIPAEIGGAAYLARLAGAATTVFNLAAYADMIRELYIRRTIIAAAFEAVDGCRNASFDNPTAGVVAKLEAQIHEAVRDNSSHAGSASMVEMAGRVLAMVEATIQTGRPQGISSGLNAFDQANGLLMPADLIVIGGSTSMGKTALAQQIIWNTARNFGLDEEKKRLTGARSLVFSMEMSGEQYSTRHLAQLSSIATERIEGEVLTVGEYETLQRCTETMRDLPIQIEDARGLTVERMRSMARRHQHARGLDLLLIDHLGFIAAPDRRMPKLDAIEANVAALKGMAQELNCPILLISHLNRGIWNRDDKRPQLSDLHGASAIEKDADVVAFIHREEYWLRKSEPTANTPEWLQWTEALRMVEGKGEIINGKRRRGRANQTRLCGFDDKATNFYDIDGRYQ